MSNLVDSVNAQLEVSARHKRLNSKTLKSEQGATSTYVVLRLSVIGVTLTSAWEILHQPVAVGVTWLTARLEAFSESRERRRHTEEPFVGLQCSVGQEVKTWFHSFHRTAQCVVCKVYFSAQLNNLKLILNFQKYYPIEHIFVPACSSARKEHFFKF